jgi:hypothetical protein
MRSAHSSPPPSALPAEAGGFFALALAMPIGTELTVQN